MAGTGSAQFTSAHLPCLNGGLGVRWLAPPRRRGHHARRILNGLNPPVRVSMKSRGKDIARILVDRVASRIETRLTSTFSLDPRTMPATKIAQLHLWHHYCTQIEAGRAPKLCE